MRRCAGSPDPRSPTRRSPTPCNRPVASTTPIAEFREAVRLDPRFSAAYLFLGRALIETGDYQEALDALARVDPGPPPADPYLSAGDLASRARDLMALEARLPAVVEGDELPADAEEGVSFARIAFARRAYVAAALPLDRVLRRRRPNLPPT